MGGSLSSKKGDFKATENVTRRLIYFRGHRQQKNSVMISKICNQWETIPREPLQISQVEYGYECATRTLAHLYNLQTVRGVVNNGVLDLSTSMSGPHDYYGYLNPFQYFTLNFQNSLPTYYEYKADSLDIGELKRGNLLSLDSNQYQSFNDYNWVPGREISSELMRKYSLDYREEEDTYVTIDNSNTFDMKENPPVRMSNEFKNENPVVVNDKKSSIGIDKGSSSNKSSADSLFAYPGRRKKDE
jgi:hypothetical protein